MASRNTLFHEEATALVDRVITNGEGLYRLTKEELKSI